MSVARPSPQQHPSAGESDLFSPVHLGAYLLANRIVRAPLTRSRDNTDGTATSCSPIRRCRWPFGASTKCSGLHFDWLSSVCDAAGAGDGRDPVRSSSSASRPRATHWRQVSTVWRSTPPTGTSSSNFSVTAATGGRMTTADRSRGARFLLDVVAEVIDACGADRVGIRLSPLSPVNDAGLDSDPESTYGHVIERLNDFGLADLHMIEGVTQGAREVPAGFALQVLRRRFVGPYMANNGYDLALALQARRANRADLISFGRAYIANPDLVERLRAGAPLNAPDRATFFGGGAHGYTDYPFMESGTEVAAGTVR